MNDGDYHQIDPWPHWLEDIYGPAPDGPRRRAEALALDKAHRHEVERRLSAAGRELSR